MENINNDELDLVTFSDEEGNEFQMEVWDYFEHEGQEYAILFDLESEQDEDRGEDAGRGLLRRGLRQLRPGRLRGPEIRQAADKGSRPFAADQI